MGCAVALGFYMAALSASRFNQDLKAKYQAFEGRSECLDAQADCSGELPFAKIGSGKRRLQGRLRHAQTNKKG